MLPALFVGVLVIPVQAQDLPDGAGKPVVLRICTGCHGAEMFASYRKGKDEWDQTITTMTEKGLAISDDDYAVVLQYLSTSLGPLPPKVNVNKASAAELEKARRSRRNRRGLSWHTARKTATSRIWTH